MLMKELNRIFECYKMYNELININSIVIYTILASFKMVKELSDIMQLNHY